jgi:hypothetical protein
VRSGGQQILLDDDAIHPFVRIDSLADWMVNERLFVELPVEEVVAA